MKSTRLEGSLSALFLRLAGGSVHRQGGGEYRVEARAGGWWELLQRDRDVVGHHRQEMNRCKLRSTSHD